MRFFVFFSLFLVCSMLFGQLEGMPFYRVYEPKEYQGHRQNWAVAQGNDGTMFFANEGLLSFDGENWQLNMLPNQRHLRSLAVDKKNIYVGGNNELGFFKKDGDAYRFTSFLHHVPDSLKNFDRVWTTLVHDDNVYYQTDTFVLRIHPDGSSKIWPFVKNEVWKLLVLNNSLYADVPFEGLMVLNKNDEFKLIPNGENLQRVGMEFLIPLEDGWLFEQRDTLKLFDGKEIVLFKNQAEKIFLEYGLDNGLQTSTGDLVFTTRKKGGVVIMDVNGNIKRHMTDKNGFSNEIVRNVFEDKDGSIWFALNAGISRLDLSSPFRYYDSRMGLDGTVFAIQRFNDKLYAGTSDGLKELRDSRFEQAGNITALVRDLDTVQNRLIVATSRDRLYALDSQGKVSVIDDSKTESKGIYLQILIPEEDPTSFVSLFEEGVFHAKWDGVQWNVQQQLHGFFEDAVNIMQPKPGEFWVDTGVRGVYKILYQWTSSGNIDFENAKVKNYFVAEGIPNSMKTLFNIGEELLVRSKQKGIFLRYSRKDDSFHPLSSLEELIGLNDTIISPTRWRNGHKRSNIWFQAERGRTNVLINSTSTLDGFTHKIYPQNTYASTFSDPRGSISFQAEKERVYFGGITGIVEYVIDDMDKVAKKPAVQITSIATSDSTYFDISSKKGLAAIRHNNSKLAFDFASTSFKGAEHKKYQYMLEGFDKVWSEPSETNWKEYTSLPPGKYTFKVKALNDYFVESPEASIQFEVKRPWYWNYFSIISYVLLIGIFTYLISQWRTRNLKRRNQQLEAAVNEAVVETKRQADEISHLYEVKNQFFSNISHELRTPLTLILGPSTDLLEDDSLQPGQRNKLTFINNNAKRLLRLINQLLDLSKLEAGKLDLKASQQNISKLVSAITESFSSMAVSQGIHLTFHSKPNEIYVFYDADKLEKVIINLLSNAMKFTESGGHVEVSLSKAEEACILKVEDSGIGIAQDQQPYVFDRFFQADNKESREHEGTGIGLSLSKELIELHGGSIALDSELNRGSIFTVTLPLGKSHLKSHQLTKFGSSEQRQVPEIEQPIEIIEEAETESGEKDLVLLVEDNTEMRSYIKTQMGEAFQFLEAENGLKGFEMAKEHVPDLIVSDVMMPKMDGTQLCEKLKDEEATSHIPIILLTAKASKEDKIQGLKIQADAYLAKPFNKEELKATVNNLIANRRKLQKRFANNAIISPRDIAVTNMEQKFLEKLVDEIETHIGDENFGVEQLAQQIHLSRSQLHRKMVSITSHTPSLYLRKYRLEKAKKMLEMGSGRVSDIAFQVGFSSPSYFTKCFVEEFGTTPTDLVK
nr:hybrid sensor histidine kinase/response regulator transcription factor [Allomuricauda sp.]